MPNFIVPRTTKQTMAWVQVSTYLQPVRAGKQERTVPESRLSVTFVCPLTEYPLRAHIYPS
jgi:hypothetical protein